MYLSSISTLTVDFNISSITFVVIGAVVPPPPPLLGSAAGGVTVVVTAVKEDNPQAVSVALIGLVWTLK